MTYPAELFSKIDKRLDFFKCRKSGKEILLFGTFHALPFSIVPVEIEEIMKTAKTLFLEINERTRSTPENKKERLNYLIAKGFISENPQDEGFDAQLDPKARKILENILKKSFLRDLQISFNQVKLEYAFWLCYFVSQDEGMEDSLEKLFSDREILALEADSKRPPLPKMAISEVNELLIRDYGCFNEPPEYSSEFLSDKQNFLTGFEFVNNFYYSHFAEEDSELTVSRNKTWLSVVSEHVTNRYAGPVLIAVGHTHLVGRQGLLCLLQNAGYEIFQYKVYNNLLSRGFEVFDPTVLFERHAKQFNIKSFFNEIDKQLNTILATNISGEDEISMLVKDYCDPWPSLVFSKIYPDRKSNAELCLLPPNIMSETISLNSNK